MFKFLCTFVLFNIMFKFLCTFLLFNLLFTIGDSYKLGLLRFGFRMFTKYKGVTWPDTSKMKSKYEHFEIFDPTLKYPTYYKKNFHAYEGGNLNWIAAEECLPASYGVFASHSREKSGMESSDSIRTLFINEIKQKVCNQELNMVDFACGIGISTNYIHNNLKGEIVGIDLSPYFLNKACELHPNLKFIHGNVEKVDIPSKSQDIVFVSYLFHELPLIVSMNVVAEASRILKSGGILAILDMKPDIKASNFMMQFIFDQTEPYLDQYRKFYNLRNSIFKVNNLKSIKEITEIQKTVIIICVRE